MNLLHLYLFRQVFFATAVAVILFGFVVLAGTAVKDVVGPVAEGRISLGQAAELIVTYLPFVLPFALPIGLLTGVLLTFGRVSAQNEITAMRSAGLGLMRIGAPVMLIGVVGTALALVINFTYAPSAKARYRERLFEIGQRDPMSLIVPGTFVRDFSDAVVYVDRREGDVLRDVWGWKLDEQRRVTEFVWADEGRLRWNNAANVLEITMINAYVQSRDRDDPEDFSGGPIGMFAGTIPFEVKLEDIFQRRTFEKKIPWMDFAELVSERQRLRGASDQTSRQRLLEVDMSLHEKASFAFSVLSFAIVGVPLGIRTRRKETSANFGIALLLTLVFYVGMLSVQWMSASPELHPELMQWLPNFGFQALGAWMWWRFGKN